MSKQRHDCNWCGSELHHETRSHSSGFCPDCHETYETESHRSLHPAEERHPHND